jgi:hypothetical protein
MSTEVSKNAFVQLFRFQPTKVKQVPHLLSMVFKMYAAV